MNNINITKNDATGAFSFALSKILAQPLDSDRFESGSIEFCWKGTDRLSIRRKVVVPIA